MLIVVIYIAHCSFYWISASIFVNLYMDWLDLSRRAVKTCNLLIVACFMAIEDFESWCFCMINWFVNVLACRQLSCTVLCTKSLFVENAYAFPSIVYAWYCIFLFLLLPLTILSCFSIGSQLLTVTCAKLTSVYSICTHANCIYWWSDSRMSDGTFVQMITLISVYIRQPYLSIFDPKRKLTETLESLNARSFLFDSIYVWLIFNDQLYHEISCLGN